MTSLEDTEVIGIASVTNWTCGVVWGNGMVTMGKKCFSTWFIVQSMVAYGMISVAQLDLSWYLSREEAIMGLQYRTLKKPLNVLEAEGLIRRRPRRGAIVLNTILGQERTSW